MINVLKYRWISAIFSASLIAGAAAMWISGKRFTYSVDFTGGTQVLFKFSKDVPVSQLKQILNDAGWSQVATREFESDEVLVRVPEVEVDSKGLGERIRQAILKVEPGNDIQILQTESVGEGIGADLRTKSIKAVIFALLAMLAYIAIRFWSVGFALGSVAALFHDAIIMLAVFLLLNREISVNVIGAILAVLGYSINDTIVIFSRIRENLKKMGNASLEHVVNVSINQTIKRTLLTSMTTGLTVGSMFILGGEALRDFSLALLVGIVFGTYSSIYIASPVMMLFYKRKKTV